MSLNEHFTKVFFNAHDNLNEDHFAEIAKDYSYSSLIQLYFLQYLKKNNSSEFEKQAQKTALHFNNINWLSWLLNDYSKNDEVNIETSQHEPELHEEIKEFEEDVISANNNFNSLKLSLREVDDKKEIPAFEPLHTVDYFASQGIKITDEPITNDKLGSQLKSFTEWLKSMKKIHVQILAEDEQSNNNIKYVAEESNKQTEVLTEAMAEVLIKQNKLGKAIDMYEKLSLINPSKRAYFAGKIESLKSL